MASYPALAAWSFVAGVGIPLVGLLNNQLAREIGSAPAALGSVFLIGLALSALATVLSGGIPDIGGFLAAQPRVYLAGVIMAGYGIAATLLIPRFGVGNFVLFILLAQVVSAAAVDHFGLFGAVRRPVDLLRLGGILIVIAGLVITQLSVQRASS